VCVCGRGEREREEGDSGPHPPRKEWGERSGWSEHATQPPDGKSSFFCFNALTHSNSPLPPPPPPSAPAFAWKRWTMNWVVSTNRLAQSAMQEDSREDRARPG